MALPVTITGISTAVAPVGPFKVAAGTYSVPVIKQVVTPSSENALYGYSTYTGLGLKLTNVASATTVYSVTITISSLGTGTFNDALYMEISSVDPSGALLATSDLISTGVVAGATLTFIFPSPTTLAANATFGVRFRRTNGSGSAIVNIAVGGNQAGSTGVEWIFDGTTWTVFGQPWTCMVNRGDVVAADGYYFFARDGTTATTLQAYKSTSPDTSWASIATKTGFTTAILNISGYQVGTTIHLVVQDGTMSSSVATKYLSFDMVSGTFLATTETVGAAAAITGQVTSGWGASIVVRSNGNAVILYNGLQVNTSGTARARMYYRERTGLNTYGTATRVDANTAVDNTTPSAVLGAADRVHFAFQAASLTALRTLSAANALNAYSTSSMTTVGDAVSYDRSGTIKVVFSSNNNGSQGTLRFDSSDNPTATFANQAIVAATIPHRIGTFPNTDDVTIVYRSSADSDLYSIKSSDDGATFAAPVSFFVGTVASADTSVSRSASGSVYTRGSSTVVGYIVNDGGTWKYNEYTLSAGVTNYTLTALTGAVALAGQAVKLARSHDLNVTAGAVAFTGQNVTLTKTAATIPLTALPGAVALAGQSVTLRVDRKMQAGTGARLLNSQNVTLRTAYKVQVGTGTLAFAGQSVTLRTARKAQAGAGAIAFTGINVDLVKTTAITHYTMTVTAGAVALAGQSVTLRIARKMQAGTGAIALAGQSVILRPTRQMQAGVGAVVLNGKSVNLRYSGEGLMLSALPGAVALVGQNVTLRYARKMVVTAGAFALAGQPVTLRPARKMQADIGARAFTGQSVTLTKASAGGALWTPALLPTGMIHWYDAADATKLTFSGSNLTAWADKSPSPITATPVNGPSIGPTLSSINGLSALHFHEQPLIGTPGIVMTNFTVFALFENEAGGAWERLVDHNVYDGWWLARYSNSNDWGGGVTNGGYPFGIMTTLPDNTVNQITIARSGATQQVSANGNTPLTQAVPSTGTANREISLGGYPGSTTDALHGKIGEVLIWNVYLSTDDYAKTEGYIAWKWGIQAKLPVGHPYASAPPTTGAPPPTNYKLEALPGAIAFSGQPVALRTAFKVQSSAGALTFGGQAITLRITRKMQVVAGALAFSGQPVTLRYTRKMVVSAGAVVLNGKSVVLKYSGEGLMLSAQPGAIALSGQSVTLRYSIKLAVTKGTFTLAGQSVALAYSRKLVATAGAIVLSGKSVNLTYRVSVNYPLVAQPGAAVLSGKSVNLTYKAPARLTAQPGAIVLAGSSVNLLAGVNYKLTVLPGGVVLRGEPILLRRGKTLTVNAGALVLTGKPVGTRNTYALVAARGSIKLTSNGVDINYFRKFTEQPGRLVFGRPGFKYIPNRW